MNQNDYHKRHEAQTNSDIMERACELAAERLMAKYGKPFEEFVEPIDSDDPDGGTVYKDMYQDEFNRFYDEEYNRIATSMKFDLVEED